MTTTDDLRQGRSAFDRNAWSQAYECLAASDAAAPLGIDDLERLAIAAYLTGRDEPSAAAWARAHNECLCLDDIPRAARCTFWLLVNLLNRGELARASGWLARTQRLLDDAQLECAERGLLLVQFARTYIKRGDIAAAHKAASRAVELADRFEDSELEVFGRLALAQVQAKRRDSAEAVSLFDEIMVAVTASDVSPIAVGIVYCAVIDGCQSLFDVGRAREWTAALSRWCSRQPDLVPFRGQCLVHRAEIMRLSGAWSDAIAEAEHACSWLVEAAGERETGRAASDLPPFKYPIGAAFYQLAELHRMRGDHREADAAYRRASEYGRSPQPGLSLLYMAQGRLDQAEAAVRRLLVEPQSPVARVAVLAAAVEVMLAVPDVETARAAADELAAMADGSRAPYLRARAAQAAGHVLLAAGDAPSALAALHEAWTGWQEIEAPYDAARVRVLRAHVCRALGDNAAAELELDAAQRVFRRLSAAPDVVRIAALRRAATSSASGALSPRELEVLALVATGKTNQTIAHELCISKRTVDRHVSNILMKLNLSSRSAATAYAYERRLV